MKGFMVLTIDIKKSTELSAQKMRNAQSEIIEFMQESTKNLQPVNSAGFTTGDEFEVVLESPDNLIDEIYLLRKTLSTEYRIGVGIGEIEDPSLRNPSQMWGTAFTRARDALNKAKTANVEICLITGDESVDRKVNIILNLIHFTRRNMTEKQRKLMDSYTYYRRFKGLKNQREYAEKIHVSDAMVSKTLKKIGYSQITAAEQLVLKMITDFFNHKWLSTLVFA